MRPPAIQWGQSIKMEKKGSRRRISIEFAGARTGALLFSDNFSPQFDPRSRKNSGTIFSFFSVDNNFPFNNLLWRWMIIYKHSHISVWFELFPSGERMRERRENKMDCLSNKSEANGKKACDHQLDDFLWLLLLYLLQMFWGISILLRPLSLLFQYRFHFA